MMTVQEESTTGELIRDALDEAKELVKLEVELAKAEVMQEVAAAKKAAIGFAIGAVFGVISLSLFAMALVLALGGTALLALGVAFGALFLCAVGAGYGWSVLPRKPLPKTRRRVEGDVRQLKEHLA
jgi:hypothetical protein